VGDTYGGLGGDIKYSGSSIGGGREGVLLKAE